MEHDNKSPPFNAYPQQTFEPFREKNVHVIHILQVQYKPGCTVIEEGERLVLIDLEESMIVPSIWQNQKVLISFGAAP